MARLSTHVLDMVCGRPAAGVRISLHSVGERVAEATTNADGRAVLMEGASLPTGIYDLIFAAGEYFRARGLDFPTPAFLDEVVIRFGVTDAAANYHVPLLLAPYGYSAYRGS